MTNFTPKMTHTGSVFDLIAFVIIIINDNNSTAAVPQGPSWDQGSVLIGIEHTEKTNLALRSLHLSWRRHKMQGEGSGVIFILPQDREVKWLAWGQAGIWRQRQHRDVLKAPRSWGPSRTHLSSPQKCLGKGDCKLAAGQCRIPRKGFQGGSGQHWMEVGVSTWPHACLQDRSMELRAAMQQTKHPVSMDLSHSLLPAQGNKPTANPTLLWLFAPKSGCGISLC